MFSMPAPKLLQCTFQFHIFISGSIYGAFSYNSTVFNICPNFSVGSSFMTFNLCPALLLLAIVPFVLLPFFDSLLDNMSDLVRSTTVVQEESEPLSDILLENMSNFVINSNDAMEQVGPRFDTFLQNMSGFINNMNSAIDVTPPTAKK